MDIIKCKYISNCGNICRVILRESMYWLEAKSNKMTTWYKIESWPVNNCEGLILKYIDVCDSLHLINFNTLLDIKK
jgi:hypothetical protein